MSEKNNQSIIDKVKQIGDDARTIIEKVKGKVPGGDELSAAELKTIAALIRNSQSVLKEANQRAHKRRLEQIALLQKNIEDFNNTLKISGLDEQTRDKIKNLRSRRRSQLTLLQAKEGLEFGGILPANKVEEIAGIIRQAEKDVLNKKKAADFMGTLVQVADISLTVISKATAVG